MNRRTLLTASLAVIGSSVAGCLGNRNSTDDPTESEENDDRTDTDTNEPSDGNESGGGDDDTGTDSRCSDDRETDKCSMTYQTRFEIVDERGDAEESASVVFGSGTVGVTGIIMGRNGCYTARLDDVMIDDETLTISIESYEDAPEDAACTGALVFIEYEAVVTMDGDLPASVRVEHNGELVTTEHAS